MVDEMFFFCFVSSGNEEQLLGQLPIKKVDVGDDSGGV